MSSQVDGIDRQDLDDGLMFLGLVKSQDWTYELRRDQIKEAEQLSNELLPLFLALNNTISESHRNLRDNVAYTIKRLRRMHVDDSAIIPQLVNLVHQFKLIEKQRQQDCNLVQRQR